MTAAKFGTRIKVNGEWRIPAASCGSPALDFIRGELGLCGTKEGCREGDCGACAVLVGEKAGKGGAVRYRAYPSCLLALGDLAGRHLITIEGLGGASSDGLTPVMRAFLEENASQCGFCTPGFIIALTAWLAEPGVPDVAGAMAAIDGNLCRCTGYGSIRRAAERLTDEFHDLPDEQGERMRVLVDRGVLPRSVLDFIAEKDTGASAGSPVADPDTAGPGREAPVSAAIGGGTDYYVRNPEPDADFSPALLRAHPELAAIGLVQRDKGLWVEVGAATTVRDFFASPLVRRAVPGIEAFEREFASTLIRNLATIGGNIANASPVGDVTSMLVGLGAVLAVGRLSAPARRLVAIEDFFLGYKKIDLREGEIIAAILLPVHDGSDQDPALFFSFEKIAKRKRLDIAAVNTAISFRIESGRFKDVRISAGGVAPVPLLLKAAPLLMEGKLARRGDPAALAALARAVSEAAEAEVSPISDVRGSADYRKRMTGRLVLAHFMRLFAQEGIAKELFP